MVIEARISQPLLSMPSFHLLHSYGTASFILSAFWAALYILLSNISHSFVPSSAFTSNTLYGIIASTFRTADLSEHWIQIDRPIDSNRRRVDSKLYSPEILPRPHRRSFQQTGIKSWANWAMAQAPPSGYVVI